MALRYRNHTGGIVPVLFFLAVLLSGGCSSSSESLHTLPANEGAPTSALEQALIDSLGDKPGGLSVLMRLDGETRTAVAGSSDAQGNMLTRDSAFHVGSISKTIVATMLLQLVEEEQVVLNDPLSNYLPEAAVGSDATVRALLSHRAGVDNYTDVPAFFDQAFADRSREFAPAELLDFVSGTSRNASGDFAYSNTHYILLGQLIERLDGGSLQASLERRITAPLGLDSTRFVFRDDQRPTSVVPAWSRGVSEGNFDIAYTSISSGAWAAGALVSNVPDLELFMDALFGGTLIQPATLDQMIQVGSDRYGLGLIEYSLDSQLTGFGHGGSIPGYLSVMLMTPDRNTSLILLTNNDSLNTNDVLQNVLEVDFSETTD